MTIDWWTVCFQTINVLVLIWLLGHFFWKPVAGMIEQRRMAAQHTLAEAEAKRTEAASALADIDKTRAGFAAERDAMLKAAQRDADHVRSERLDQASKLASEIEDAAKARIAKEAESSEAAMAARARQLALDIAARLAGRLSGPAVQDAFLEWLIAAIRELPDGTRQMIAQDGATLDVASATSLASDTQERYRERIVEALGGNVMLRFETDSSLIAGLELRGPHLAVANSWRADLERINADIGHGGKS